MKEFLKSKVSIAIGLILISFLVVIGVVIQLIRAKDIGETAEAGNKVIDSGAQPADVEGVIEEPENVIIDINISDYYTTNTGYPMNFYYIDEKNILWGCGENRYGQLGQGKQDYDYHEDMVKIAENVIHVDYSQRGFMIYITEDNKLYGVGNAGSGALQLPTFSREQYVNDEFYPITKPVLLMEDVIYAKCGRDDIVAMDKDKSVWIWGTIWIRDGYCHQREPLKVLENAAIVTGGPYNHAALLRDGTVWTWGYNYTGNCGVEDKLVVPMPEKVAENVDMVWTGSMTNNIDCQDIKEFEGVYEFKMENTIIRKIDGSYWICGANVGNEERILPIYYEVSECSMICTHEFLPYDLK